MAALEEDCLTLPGKDGSFVILPKSTETFQDVAVNRSITRVKLVQLDPQINTTRDVVMAYPFRLTTDVLLRHLQVEEATRCQTLRTRQVIVTLRGPLLP